MWHNEMEALRRDIQALRPGDEDMDEASYSNNILISKIENINFPQTFKLPKETYKGHKDPIMRLM